MGSEGAALQKTAPVFVQREEMEKEERVEAKVSISKFPPRRLQMHEVAFKEKAQSEAKEAERGLGRKLLR